MINTYFLLLFEFIKVGLFTYGGGYASLPFLYHIAENYNWFSLEQLTQMIAISGITPGPVGLNMATFAGYKTLGVAGAICASFALILPMILITTQIFRLYKKFSENKCVEKILYVLRPTSCALICAVGIRLFYELILGNTFSFEKVDLFGLCLLLFLFVLTFKLKRDPIIYIAIAAFFGILLSYVK